MMWDFDRAERRPPVKNARAIVSVAFSREQFERVARAAERLNMKVSAFIRQAVFEYARPVIQMSGAWGGGPDWTT